MAYLNSFNIDTISYNLYVNLQFKTYNISWSCHYQFELRNQRSQDYHVLNHAITSTQEI